jgi:pyruvate dehydrogenase E2 component (dihydrolipoamide acetyltransferase)
VPVIKFADQKSIQDISKEAKALAEKASTKKLLPTEMEGSTFTVSNLGMFGIEEFTAIINEPNACILAVGAIRQVPIVVNNEIKVANMMKVTLSSDHRVVDGAVGAKFLQSLKKALETPVGLIL